MSGLESLLVNVYGGALVGVMLTSTLFGIITVQAYKYFQSFPRDSIYTKIMVVFLWILQVFEVACTTKALYWYLVNNAGNRLLLVDAIWEGTTYQTVSTVASMTTQTFFALRVYSLSHNIWLGLFMEALVFAQCSLGAVTAAKAYIYANFPEIALKEKWLVLAWLACEALSDTAIATAMVLLLRKQRTGFIKTDGMINTLIIYSINTGAITSFVAIVTLITFAIAEFHFVVLALAPPLGGLYTVSVLANLHSRTKIRRMFYAKPESSIPMKIINLQTAISSDGSSKKQRSSSSIDSGRPARAPGFNGLTSYQSGSVAISATRPRPPQPQPPAAHPPIPRGGVHIHVQTQSEIVADSSLSSPTSPTSPQSFTSLPRRTMREFLDAGPPDMYRFGSHTR